MRATKKRDAKPAEFSWHFAAAGLGPDLLTTIESGLVSRLQAARTGQSSGAWRWVSYTLDGHSFRAYLESFSDHHQIIVTPVTEEMFASRVSAWEEWFLAVCQEMNAIMARTVAFGGWTRLDAGELKGELRGLDYLQYFGPRLSQALSLDRLTSAFPRHRILPDNGFAGWVGDSPFVPVSDKIPVTFRSYVASDVNSHRELLRATPPPAQPFAVGEELRRLKAQALPAAAAEAEETVQEWKGEYPDAEESAFDFVNAAWLMYSQNEPILETLEGNKDLALVRWAVVLGPEMFATFTGREDGINLLRRFIARFDTYSPLMAESIKLWAAFYEITSDDLVLVIQELANAMHIGNNREPVSISEIQAAILLIAWSHGYRSTDLRRWVLNRYLLGGSGLETLLPFVSSKETTEGVLGLEWANISQCNCSECQAFRTAHPELYQERKGAKS
jgi:hypothetical protein